MHHSTEVRRTHTTEKQENKTIFTSDSYWWRHLQVFTIESDDDVPTLSNIEATHHIQNISISVEEDEKAKQVQFCWPWWYPSQCLLGA